MCVYGISAVGTFIYYGYSGIPRYRCAAISLLQRLWFALLPRWSLYYFIPQNELWFHRHTFRVCCICPSSKSIFWRSKPPIVLVSHEKTFFVTYRKLSSGLLCGGQNNIVAHQLTSSSSRLYSLPVDFVTCRVIIFHTFCFPIILNFPRFRLLKFPSLCHRILN